MAEEHVAETPEVEAPAQEAVETNPFDGEFDPDRARRTIDNLRNEVRETKERYSSDEWFEKQLAERGLALPDEEEPQPAEDPYDDRITTLEQTLQERQEREAWDAQYTHIEQLASEAGVKLTDRMKTWISHESYVNGFNPQATEAAFASLNEELDAYGKQAVESYLKSKRAPSPPQAGTAGQPSGDFDPKDENSRKQRMAAIFASRQE